VKGRFSLNFIYFSFFFIEVYLLPEYVSGVNSWLVFSDLEWFTLTKHTVLVIHCTCLLCTTDLGSRQFYGTIFILKRIKCSQAELSCSQWQIIQHLYFLHYPVAHILRKDRKVSIRGRKVQLSGTAPLHAWGLMFNLQHEKKERKVAIKSSGGTCL
jgi:hypothetical protein